MAAGFRIAVFASGQGSNFQNLLDASRAGTLGADIVLLVCDKPQAPVVERARKAGVDCFLFQPKDYARREDYEAEVAAELDKRQIDLVVLAGYMRLLTPVLVEPYAGKMINIHPSLLPAFPGKNAIGQAWDYGVKVTGITVHLVDGEWIRALSSPKNRWRFSPRIPWSRWRPESMPRNSSYTRKSCRGLPKAVLR